MRHGPLAQRVRAFAENEPWPSLKDARWNLFRGRVQRISTRPNTFTWTLFPVALVASHLGIDASEWLWESVRPLEPLPDDVLDAPELVVYCGSGVSAAPVVQRLVLAGRADARLYPGSFSEWCRHPSNPIERGPAT